MVTVNKVPSYKTSLSDKDISCFHWRSILILILKSVLIGNIEGHIGFLCKKAGKNRVHLIKMFGTFINGFCDWSATTMRDLEIVFWPKKIKKTIRLKNFKSLQVKIYEF